MQVVRPVSRVYRVLFFLFFFLKIQVFPVGNAGGRQDDNQQKKYMGFSHGKTYWYKNSPKIRNNPPTNKIKSEIYSSYNS